MFHDIHAAEDDGSGESSVDTLVKLWVLQVMIVEANEDCQRHQKASDKYTDLARFLKAEQGVGCDTSGVDHGKFINKLHRI